MINRIATKLWFCCVLVTTGLGLTANSASAASREFQVMETDPSTGEWTPTSGQQWVPDVAGFSMSESFTVDSGTYVAFVKHNTGEVEIWQWRGGMLDGPLYSYDLDHPWTAMAVADMSQPELVLLDGNTGLLQRHEIGSDGSLGTMVSTQHPQLEGKQILDVYPVGSSWNLVAMNQFDHRWAWFDFPSGAYQKSGRWGTGWSHLDTVVVGGSTYRLVYNWFRKDDDIHYPGTLVIKRLYSGDPSQGTNVVATTKAAGWTSVRFHERSDGRVYLVGYEGATGKYRTYRFTPNGYWWTPVLQYISSRTSDVGWTAIAPIHGTDEMVVLNEEGIDPISHAQLAKMVLPGSDNPDSIANAYRDDLVLDGRTLGGYQFGIMQSGRMLHEEGWGNAVESDGVSMTFDTSSDIGSVSKVLITTTLLKMVEWGEIELDAPIVLYLDYDAFIDEGTGTKVPLYSYNDFNFITRMTTVRQLLTQTSGQGSTRTCKIADGDAAYYNVMDCRKMLTSAPPKFIDICGGRDYSANVHLDGFKCRRQYSNSNFAFAQQIVDWAGPADHEWDADEWSMTTETHEVARLTYRAWMKQAGLRYDRRGNDWSGDDAAEASCWAPNRDDIEYYDWGKDDFPTNGITNPVYPDLHVHCGTGGWRSTGRGLMKFLRAVRYEQALGPELTWAFTQLDRTTGINRTQLGWDSLTPRKKNGAKQGRAYVIEPDDDNTVDMAMIVNFKAPDITKITEPDPNAKPIPDKAVDDAWSNKGSP